MESFVSTDPTNVYSGFYYIQNSYVEGSVTKYELGLSSIDYTEFVQFPKFDKAGLFRAVVFVRVVNNPDSLFNATFKFIVGDKCTELDVSTIGSISSFAPD